VRIAGVIKIIAPLERRVFGGQHRMFVAVQDTVAVFLWWVFAADESGMDLLQLLQFSGEVGLVHANWIDDKIIFPVSQNETPESFGILAGRREKQCHQNAGHGVAFPS
jgi:hypothetical protein